jgi:hypothetical protein
MYKKPPSLAIREMQIKRYSKILSHPHQNSHYQENKCWQGGKGPCTLLVWMWISPATIENSMGIFHKIKITIWSSSTIAGYILEGIVKSAYSKDKELFTIAKLWNQLRCSLMDEWIKNTWCIYIYIQWSII